MAELIRKEDALRCAMFHQDTFGNFSNWKYICSKDIENMPGVDAEFVVHAYWIRGCNVPGTQPTSFVCSSCTDIANYNYRYCPNCGAKMDSQTRLPRDGDK